MNESRKAFVTIVIGEKYQEFYNKNFRDSHERFAKKNGIPLIVIDDYIDKSPKGLERHPAWQKLLIFKTQLTEQFDSLCWIDADIYITREARNPFNEVPQNSWGAVRNNFYDLEDYRESDLNLYKYCKMEDRPSYLLNTGFFIVERGEHAKLLEFVYRNYEEQPCYENGPLSYHLLTTTPGIELDGEFNQLVPLCMKTYGSGVFAEYKILKESSFIHFCGGINKNLLNRIRIMDDAKDIIQNKIFRRKANG